MDDASPASALLSVRVWTYLLAFGGITGVLLRTVGRVHEPKAAVGALAVGAVAAAMARAIIGRASREGRARARCSRGDLVGQDRAVIVPFAGGATGKIRVRVAGADVDVLATAEGEGLDQHDEVLMVEVREGGTALVTRNPASK